jgi:hypothetical protein
MLPTPVMAEAPPVEVVELPADELDELSSFDQVAANPV